MPIERPSKPHQGCQFLFAFIGAFHTGQQHRSDGITFLEAHGTEREQQRRRGEEELLVAAPPWPSVRGPLHGTQRTSRRALGAFRATPPQPPSTRERWRPLTQERQSPAIAIQRRRKPHLDVQFSSICGRVYDTGWNATKGTVPQRVALSTLPSRLVH